MSHIFLKSGLIRLSSFSADKLLAVSELGWFLQQNLKIFLYKNLTKIGILFIILLLGV
ncbi:hypothetical protein LT85_2104 [Collimonas arenae]|uniref:Uncharacterized protein n=1 Tax=Collimonas arenae TaxID=279058 RepID=A0A0A1FEM5_9BURK|nr:hypothetical protein LT85_2104 [Collimonas arenae]